MAGLGEAAITELKIVEAAARRLAQSNMETRRNLGSSSAVLDYCRTAMAYIDHEEFRILFLDKKNQLLADEVQGVGTVDHAPVYPREVMRRALELNATALILVHNHPSAQRGGARPPGHRPPRAREFSRLEADLRLVRSRGVAPERTPASLV